MRSFLSSFFRFVVDGIFLAPSLLEEDSSIVHSLYVVIMVIRTRDLLAGYRPSRYYPVALVFNSHLTLMIPPHFVQIHHFVKACNAIYILFLAG